MKNLVTRSVKKSQELVTVRCDPARKVLVAKDRKTIKWYNIPHQLPILMCIKTLPLPAESGSCRRFSLRHEHSLGHLDLNLQNLCQKSALSAFNISRGRLRVPLLRHFKGSFKGATAAATATATAATSTAAAAATTAATAAMTSTSFMNIQVVKNTKQKSLLEWG